MMDILEAMHSRHSVRRYTSQPIAGDTLEQLQEAIMEGNQHSGLHMQLCLNEPLAFSSTLARYGKFHNVRNYIAVVGRTGPALEETSGYYGEQVVLKAQQLGLNTCWAALTYSRKHCVATIEPGEKLLIVIALGYGESQGQAHKSKPLQALYRAAEPVPDWFMRGVEAAQLAPTALNQQKFIFSLEGSLVSAKPGWGFYTKLDLGIAKCHFELGAGSGDWAWNQPPATLTT